MRFDLKLFVLVGILAGFRDVWGGEDDFYVNKKVEENKELKAAVDERRVIRAVYKTQLDGYVFIINKAFQDKLSKVLVWNGVKEVNVNNFAVNEYDKIYYGMKGNVEYTVYFIFKKECFGGTDGNLLLNSTVLMFYDCTNLIYVDFRCFNTTNVTDMSKMFSFCSALEELNLSKFDTKNVTKMCRMFYNCTALKKLNLSNFDTQNVKDMSFMFACCGGLRELNLSNFDFPNVCDMDNMFFGCEIKKLFLPKKYKDIRERCCCCCGGYVYINDMRFEELDPNNVKFV